LIKKKVIKSFRDYDDYCRSVNERNCRVLNTYEGDKGINNLLLNGKKIKNVDFISELQKQTRILEKKAKKKELVEKV